MDEPKALRFNEGKPELHYIWYYPKFLEALSYVQSQGAIKYGYGNWRYGGKSNREYWDSASRHLAHSFQALLGNNSQFDEDLGVLSLAQAIWNLIQIIELNYDGPLFDPDFDQDSFGERWKDFPKNERPI